MNPDEIRQVIDIAVAQGPQTCDTRPCIPTWDAEMADAFALIERHDRRVGLVLVHTKHRYRFAEVLQRVLSDQTLIQEEEGPLGMLWGADVWHTPRIPEGTVLVISDLQHIDPKKLAPDTIVGITAQPLFP
jgi:hypothetical protein